MSPYEAIAILLLTAYAVYQQTRRHQIIAAKRFKLAIIYGVVGLVVGGIQVPHTKLAASFLVASVLLSLVVGQVRGRLTRIWIEDGRLYSQGTPTTVALFVALIASKFALGTAAYLLHDKQTGGIGEVLLMLAAMIAVQAQLIHRRANRITTGPSMPSSTDLARRVEA
jgi:hypothetical protein